MRRQGGEIMNNESITIKTNREQDRLLLEVEGSLDTVTAPQLERELSEKKLDGVRSLILNFTELEYVSSAGLRVLLAADNRMYRKGGEMVVRDCNDTVMKIFEVTGFDELLTLEVTVEGGDHGTGKGTADEKSCPAEESRGVF